MKELRLESGHTTRIAFHLKTHRPFERLAKVYGTYKVHLKSYKDADWTDIVQKRHAYTLQKLKLKIRIQ